jgi:hypothetical protein
VTITARSATNPRHRIGADAMLHILTKTSIFIKLPNECLCQMAGEPLVHVVPLKFHGYMLSNDSCTYDLGKRKRDPLEGSGARKRIKLIRWKVLPRALPKGITKAEVIPCER